MKDIYKDCITSGYSNSTETASDWIPFVTAAIKKMKRFFHRIQAEQARSKLQISKKQQMQCQLYRDTIKQMPMDVKIKMGLYRF